jgi:hypothetical protein
VIKEMFLDKKHLFFTKRIYVALICPVRGTRKRLPQQPLVKFEAVHKDRYRTQDNKSDGDNRYCSVPSSGKAQQSGQPFLYLALFLDGYYVRFLPKAKQENLPPVPYI